MKSVYVSTKLEPGLVLMATLISATIAIGAYARVNTWQVDRPVAAKLPKPTHTSLKLASYGYSPTALRGIRDIKGLPIVEPNEQGLAMWIKFDIPNGHSNFPMVNFKLQDTKGNAFPFHDVWVKNGAYLLLPKGYAALPDCLLAVLKQNDETVGHAELPQLPPPTRVVDRMTDKPWPGFSIERCQALATPDDCVTLLIKGAIGKGHSLIAYSRGTSACTHDACDGFRYLVQAPGKNDAATIGMRLNYPKTTHKLYLELVETKPNAKSACRRVPYGPEEPGVPVRRMLVAVDLDARGPVVDPACRRSTLLVGPGLGFSLTIS